MVCAEHMRIINNSIRKVKALAKGEIEQGPFSQDNLITREHGEQQQPFQGDRIYQVTDGLKSNYTKRDYSRLCIQTILEKRCQTQDLQVLLDYKPKVIEQMVIGYVEMLRDKGRTSKTIYLHCSAIFHFFEMNDMVLNRGKITRFIPPDESPNHLNSDKAYTLEQIGRILDSCDVREKAVILLMASTGMRIGAIPGLRVGNLTSIQCPDFSLLQNCCICRIKKRPLFYILLA